MVDIERLFTVLPVSQLKPQEIAAYGMDVVP
jgi:hypothetical protein